MSDIKALLRDAKLPEKTVDVCLRGDLTAEYETLQGKLERIGPSTSLAGGTGAAQIREDMERIRAEMAGATVMFRLRALTRRAYRDLVDQHPPRRDGDNVDQGDAVVGINRETFYEPLIRASVVEPELDDEDWKLLLEEKLNDAQFDTLAYAAHALNRRDVDVPFSLNGLPATTS